MTWLDQVHVSAQDDDLIEDGGRGHAGHHQHAGAAAFAQQAQQAQAIDAGQHHVQHVEVEVEGLLAAQQIVAVGKPARLNAVGAEVLGQVLAVDPVVIDQSQGLGCRDGQIGAHARSLEARLWAGAVRV